MTETKLLNISKGAVVTAYEKVKANKGTYGVDEQSIEDFEKTFYTKFGTKCRQEVTFQSL